MEDLVRTTRYLMVAVFTSALLIFAGLVLNAFIIQGGPTETVFTASIDISEATATPTPTPGLQWQ